MPVQWLKKIPCEDDAWPFTGDIGVFEARRTVGQMARTLLNTTAINNARSHRAVSEPHLILVYLSCANVLADSVKTVVSDLVAEARTHDIPWNEIGKIFDIGGTGAQKRFGNNLDSEKMARAFDEALVVRLIDELASGPYPGMEVMQEDLEGSTPIGRIEYAQKHIWSACAAFRKLEKRMTADSGPRTGEVLEVLYSISNKISLASVTLLSDPAQLEAIAEWTRQDIRPKDATCYFTPATYLYHALRLIMLACNHTARATDHIDETLKKDAPEEIRAALNVDMIMSNFTKAVEILETVMLILARDDVQSVLPHDMP
jgi:hypothetical protein